MSAHCSSVRPRLGGGRAMALAGGLPWVQVEQLGGEVDGISIGPASETVIVGFVQHHTGVVVGVERTAHHAMAVGFHAVHLSHLPNGDGGLDLLI